MAVLDADRNPEVLEEIRQAVSSGGYIVPDFKTWLKAVEHFSKAPDQARAEVMEDGWDRKTVEQYWIVPHTPMKHLKSGGCVAPLTIRGLRSLVFVYVSETARKTGDFVLDHHE